MKWIHIVTLILACDYYLVCYCRMGVKAPADAPPPESSVRNRESMVAMLSNLKQLVQDIKSSKVGKLYSRPPYQADPCFNQLSLILMDVTGGRSC